MNLLVGNEDDRSYMYLQCHLFIERSENLMLILLQLKIVLKTVDVRLILFM